MLAQEVITLAQATIALAQATIKLAQAKSSWLMDCSATAQAAYS